MKATKRRDVVSWLNSLGFVYDCDGKHPIFKCTFTGFRIPVPNGRDISPGTLRDINKLIAKAKALRSNADESNNN